MSLRSVLLLCFCLSIFVGSGAYWCGWNNHAMKVISDQIKRKKEAEKIIQPIEDSAAKETAESKVIYRTITRDVVRYVQDPNRTVCKFDDDAIRLRQQAIDAANSIPGFDAATVQSK